MQTEDLYVIGREQFLKKIYKPSDVVVLVKESSIDLEVCRCQDFSRDTHQQQYALCSLKLLRTEFAEEVRQ